MIHFYTPRGLKISTGLPSKLDILDQAKNDRLICNNGAVSICLSDFNKVMTSRDHHHHL